MALGAGDDLYVIFASSLTLKSWDRIVDPSADHLVLEDSAQEKESIQVGRAYRGGMEGRGWSGWREM